MFARKIDPNDDSPWLRSNQFPVKDACNPYCPDESWLWCLMGAPGTNGAPSILPIPTAQVYSRHLFNLFGPPPKNPKLKFRPPSGREPNWMTAVGTWVPIDEPDPPRKPWFRSLPFDKQLELRKQALESLTPEEIRDLLGVANDEEGNGDENTEP
ncbi:phage gene 29 protein family protein [Gordonia paraffinivorans]|uniref:phage gene 29 protein family protein n=1 Tax=Gordonia paraffinivorans TaxID=175628 RepID=UPI003FCEC921